MFKTFVTIVRKCRFVVNQPGKAIYYSKTLLRESNFRLGVTEKYIEKVKMFRRVE